MGIDILCLNTHSYLTRNTEAYIPVYNYLTLYNLKIKHGSLFNGYYLILKYRPKVVFFEGIFGGRWHCQVAFFAKRMGCKVVSLLAEGASLEWARNSPEKIWGWLDEKKAFWDAHFFWNQSTIKCFSSFFPEAKSNIYMTGGCGFDRYKFSRLHALSVEKYAAVVGVGCWIFNQNKQPSDWYRDCRDFFSTTLLEIIRKNKDILFLIKPHPSAEDDLYLAAVENCVNEKNVLLVPANTPIIDCLATSDIWLSFESNTAMEAWLMGKQTALLNPSGINFPYQRQPFWKGQPNYATAEEWNMALSAFKATGQLPGFAEREKERNNLYEEIIGHADGLNHVRTGNVILDILTSPFSVKTELPSLPWFKLAVNSFLRWHFGKFYRFMPQRIPWFAAFKEFYDEHRKDYSEEEFAAHAATRLKEQLAFYQRNSLDLKALRKIY